jgi:hypothetical protein
MSDTPMTYIAILYVAGRSVPVCKTMLSKERADLIMNDPNPIITDKSTEKDYRVVGKQTFTYNNTDQSKTFFIICQTVQIIKKED